MKKVLFATTALVASASMASMASAEVKLTGYAEIGVIGGSAMETQFHDDMDVSFHLSGESDNGLSFGAKIDLDEVSGGISNTSGPAVVWVKGAFGSITLGDTDGALDWAMQDTGIGTSLTDDHTTHAGYGGNSEIDSLAAYDGQIMRYDNTFGDFAVALSVMLDDTGVLNPAWGIGAKYNASLGGVDLGLGVAYQDYDTDSAWGVSVDAKMAGGFRAILNYSDLGDTDGGGVGETHSAIGLGYTMNALTVSANYGQYDEGSNSQDGYGFAVNYDLGGGAVVMAGYGKSECGAAPVYASCVANTSPDTWSLGLGLSF